MTDEQISAVIEESDGHWVDDDFRINGKDLMNLCRAVALLSASKPVAPAQSGEAIEFEKLGREFKDCFGHITPEEALRAINTRAASPAAPAQSGEPVNDGDLVLVERGLLGSACSAIDKKRDAPKTLKRLREVIYAPRAPSAVMPPEALDDDRTQSTFKEFRASLARLNDANTPVSIADRVMILSNATFLLDEYAPAATR